MSAATPLCTSPSCRGPHPAPDAFVCPSCLAEVRAVLLDVPDTMDELLVNMTRQDVAPPQPGGGGSDDPPLLYRPEATEAGRDLHATLVSWVRHLLEARGLGWDVVLPPPPERPPGAPYGPLRPPGRAGGLPVPGAYTYPRPGAHTDTSAGRLPGDDTVEMALWLARHLATIAADVAGGQLVDEVVVAVTRCRYAVDRPADRIYLGPCACSIPLEPQVDLYAHPDAVMVTCRVCEAQYHVATRRQALLDRSRGLLVTAELASRALPGLLGVTLTPEIVRGLHRHHALARHQPLKSDPHRRWRYRVGDIIDLVGGLQLAAERRAAGRRAARPPIEELPEELRAAVTAVAAHARQPVPSGVESTGHVDTAAACPDRRVI